MGNVEPGPVTAVTTAGSGVWLTRFPAAALTGIDGQPADWTNHREAHRAVMRLFGPNLGGDPRRRRATGGILYRLDVLGGEHVVLVQSTREPELLPKQAQGYEIAETSWNFSGGEKVALRVAVNPVRRRTVPRDDGRKKQLTELVAAEDVPAWLAQKVSSSLETLEVRAHYRDTTVGEGHHVVVDTIDALATVGDPAAFAALRRHGVGRSKAYGCGLLTAMRVMVG